MQGISCRPDEEDVLAIVAFIRGNPEVDNANRAVKAAELPLRGRNHLLIKMHL